MAAGIQDHKSNVTRFVVLSDTDHSPTGCDKTSLCFSFDADRAGLLYSVLGELVEHDINLSKIESRPSKEKLGRYIFLADIEGHRSDTVIAEILSKIDSQTSLFKVLGSYPRYHR
jgi:prephenate dehydratase